jgi:hypothetical protein
MPVRSPAPHLIAEIPVFRATELRAVSGGGSWQFEDLVGILSEISEESACGAVSFVAEIILQAQYRNEPAAWVAGSSSAWFPPDLSYRGVDLAAVAVIRAGGEAESLTAAEWLVRSGGWGLVIVDAGGEWKASDASLGRIQKLAERARCAAVFLTRKPPHEPPLGSRISLRGCVAKAGTDPSRVVITTTRDKRSNTSTQVRRHYHGPPGLY